MLHSFAIIKTNKSFSTVLQSKDIFHAQIGGGEGGGWAQTTGKLLQAKVVLVWYNSNPYSENLALTRYCTTPTSSVS